MGKRKHKDKDSHIRKKIKRLRQQLVDSSETSGDSDHRSLSPCESQQDRVNYTESDDSDVPIQYIRSAVVTGPQLDNINSTLRLHGDTEQEIQTSIPHQPAEPGPSTSTIETIQEPLSLEILEALGEPKGKDETFGPPIPEEIAKRWGCILVDGLTKEQKQEGLEKSLVPENFKLAKAPLLNPEIIPVLSDSVKNRDKLLEKAQNHLGYGIAGITNLTCSIINGDMNKLELLRKISDVNKILLDLHYENTKTRRKLVITSLDKKFTQLITDVKRDAYLFGSNLGEKIKASKTAERSGLQIKRNDAVPSSRKYSQQGNWRGPPKSQGQQPRRQGGPKPRYHGQANKRSTTASYRQNSSSKTNSKTHKP